MKLYRLVNFFRQEILVHTPVLAAVCHFHLIRKVRESGFGPIVKLGQYGRARRGGVLLHVIDGEYGTKEAHLHADRMHGILPPTTISVENGDIDGTIIGWFKGNGI